MEKDVQKTEVIFRKWKTKSYGSVNEVLAIFPYVIESYDGLVGSYLHNGQHGTADYCHCIKMTVPAKENEYINLKKELESFGYDFNIIRRRNREKYIKALCKSRNIDYYGNSK